MFTGKPYSTKPSLPLYPGLLHGAFERLPAPLRVLYGSAKSTGATGNLDIERGEGRMRRVLGWLWGLPPTGTQVRTHLVIDRRGSRETWSRRFGSHSWVTRQRPVTGWLAERYGPIEVRMQLSVVEGELRFKSVGGVLCVASQTLELPRWLVPQVSARSWVEGNESSVHLWVELSAARFGMIARYTGVVTPQVVKVRSEK